MGIKEKKKDTLQSISGKEAELYRQDVSLLIQGILPKDWDWVPCSENALVAERKYQYPIYYKEFLSRNIFETLKAFFRGSRCLRTRKNTDILIRNGFNSPAVICWGKGKKNELILLEADKGKGFYTYLLENFSPPLTKTQLHEKRHLLFEAGKLIGLLHKKRIIHGDLRPNNLLISKNEGEYRFSFIDNESNKCSKINRISLVKKNLIQLSLIFDNLLTQTDLLRIVFSHNSIYFNDIPRKAQRKFIKTLFSDRLKRVTHILTRCKRKERAKKIRKINGRNVQGECYQNTNLCESLLKESDLDVLIQKNGEIIKEDKGITAAIIKSCSNRSFFCKRFLPKNKFHFLKVLYAGERARILWRISHAFLDLGIPVPQPIAYVVYGHNPLMHKGLFFSAALPETKTLLSISRDKVDFSDWISNNNLLVKIAENLALMHNYGYSHGDTKWGNILINEGQNSFCWIDLDSAKKNSNMNNRWFYKDVARFAVDIIESSLEKKWFDIFVESYAAKRRMSPRQLHEKIKPFVKKIHKRHRRKSRITTGSVEKTAMWFKRTTNSMLRKLHRFFKPDEVLVLGDSHVEVFKHWKFIQAFPSFTFSVCSVGGATASGLENPNSKTQAYTIFSKALEEKKRKKVIIMLGEVDTGFVIWYRAQKYGVDVTHMLTEAVKNYCSFLADVSTKADQIIVISTPLPTIKDRNAMGEVANLRKSVKTTIHERTALTLKFNREIEKYCKTQDITFINLDDDCLGVDGAVKKEMKSKNPRDHHYDQRQFSQLIIKRVGKFIHNSKSC